MVRGKMTRFACGLVAAATAAALANACGGSPSSPTPPVAQPPVVTPPVAPANNLPVIDSIVLRGTRPQEPTGFADLGEKITVVAKVRDDETPVEQLIYEWSAPVGTFTGTGASVTWQAPATGTTPSDVTFTLKVTEKYGPASNPQGFSHDVSGTATLSLHDSVKEVADMARQFLLDFSDSNIRDTKFILRNFDNTTPACIAGHDSEFDDVDRNRINYRILSSFVGNPAVTVKFSTLCEFRERGADACAEVAVDWHSVRLTDNDFPGGTPKGGTEHAFGIDQVTAVYLPAQKKWNLCESDFNGSNALGVRSSFIK
jgi:hypothetical protein